MSLNAAKAESKHGFKVSRDVHINAMPRPNPILNTRYEMERKVGGFILGGGTYSRSTIIIEKDVFTPGEFINVRI